MYYSTYIRMYIVYSHITDNQLQLTYICYYLQMQGAYLVADDIMDHSLTRRGKPCWYKQVYVVYVHNLNHNLIPTTEQEAKVLCLIGAQENRCDH